MFLVSLLRLPGRLVFEIFAVSRQDEGDLDKSGEDEEQLEQGHKRHRLLRRGIPEGIVVIYGKRAGHEND